MLRDVASVSAAARRARKRQIERARNFKRRCHFPLIEMPKLEQLLVASILC
jgi:hypothetical protein